MIVGASNVALKGIFIVIDQKASDIISVTDLKNCLKIVGRTSLPELIKEKMIQAKLTKRVQR